METLSNGPRREFGSLAVLIAITFCLYLGSLPKEFTNWDDIGYITQNPLIQSLSMENLSLMFTEPYYANFAPITLLSYAADYQLWGLNPTAFHFHNVALHLACILMLYHLLKQFALGWTTALAVTTLVAIHPVNVEAVSWASERKTLLSALFFLISFYHYIRFRKAKTSTNYLMSLLFFLFSILSKAGTVVGPVIFLAYDSLVLGQRFRQLQLYDKLPFIIAAELHLFLSIHAAGVGTTLFSYHEQGPIFSLFASGYLLEQYLGLLLWPVGLSALYNPIFEASWTNPRLWIPLAVLVTGGALLAKRSSRSFFWLAFFLVLLVPVLNIVPLPVMLANRYLYLPQIGVFVLAVLAAHWLARRISFLPVVKVTCTVVLAAWVLLLGRQTYAGTQVWRNSHTLWTDALEKNFVDPVAHYNLGKAYQVQGLGKLAAHEFLISLSLDPKFPAALLAVADGHLRRGELSPARDRLYEALALTPDSPQLLLTLGQLFYHEGRTSQALAMFLKASYLNPRNIEIRDHIVVVLLNLGKIEAALDVAQGIVDQFPESPLGFYRRGLGLEAQGDAQGALESWQESLRRLPRQHRLFSELKKKLEDLEERQP